MKTKRVIITILVIFLMINFSVNINNYAVDFISNQKERNNGILIGAEAFSIKKDPDTTALLIHGITASPKDFIDLADYLSSKNISIETILLPGHGTSPKDLATKKYTDWTSAINNKLENINSKNIFLIGYSLGGTLTLDIAERKNLNGIVVMNAPILLQNKFVPFIYLINIVEKYHVREPESIILAQKEKRVAYDAVPLKTISEITKLIDQLNLQSIEEPTFIIQTNNDTIVIPESANLIYNRISSKEKKLTWLEISTHGKPYKKEQEEIFEEIYIFIKENSVTP